MALGRGLVADDARAPGAEPVAVLTDPAWTRLFGRDPAVLGREIDANGGKLIVVGVMAPAFVGLDDSPRDLWAPLTMYGLGAGGNLFGGNQPRQLRLTARLRHDVTPQQVEGSLAIEPFETRVVRACGRRTGTPPAAGDADARHADGVRVPVSGVRRVRLGARDGVRQRVERHARARERAPPRNRHPSLDWREPRPDRPAARHRRPADCHPGRAHRAGAGRGAASPGCVLLRRDAPADDCRTGAPSFRSTSTIAYSSLRSSSRARRRSSLRCCRRCRPRE